MLRKVILAVLLLMCIGCSERSEISLRPEQASTFDVTQAKEAFVRDYTAAVEARSETTRAQSQIYYTLADTDYTPLWDKAKNTENDHVLSIDVPLYSVSGAFASDTDGENMRMATQKLIVIQSKKSGDTFSYLLTLCPDVACAEKYSDLNDVFTHLGDCSKFSGLAIYTSLAGELVAVNKFVNGTEAGYVYVGNPEADQHALHHQAEHLMEGMKFYLSSGPVTVTRGGSLEDFIHENLCRNCLSYPCLCQYEDFERCPMCGKPKWEEHPVHGKCECYYEICGTCGRAKPQDGESGGAFCECPTDTERCMWCGEEVIKGKQCDCGNEPFKECSECHHFPCTCKPCPKCGYKTCTGCTDNQPEEPTPPYEPEEPEEPTEPSDPDDICQYCNYHCGRTCEAYCHICEIPKEHCDAHRCNDCGKINNECECK